MDKYTIQTCSVCKHPDRDEIEKEIMAHIRTQRSIAREFNLNETSLSNHKNKHMMGSVKDKLRQIVQKSIMDGLAPDNMSELIRLMDYVEKMESENYLDGKSQWDSTFDEKYKCFKRMFCETFFNDISEEQKRQILIQVKSCFLKTPPRDIGEYTNKMLDMGE